MEKEKLEKILVEIRDMLHAMHSEVLNESQNVRVNLGLILEGKNIPSGLPSTGLEKIVTIFKDESYKLHNDELVFNGLRWDAQAILDDIGNDNVNKSTKRLLGRLHTDCCHNAKLREKALSSLTGKALAMLN